MLQLTFLIPLIAGIVVFFLPANKGRLVLFATAAVHATITALEWFKVTGPLQTKYFSKTPEGMLVMAILSFLFLSSIYYSM